MNNMIKVFGKNAVREVLKGSRKVEKIVILENTFDEDILNIAKQKHIKIEILKKTVFNSLYKEKNQGVVCFVEDYKYLTIDELLEKHKFKDEVLFLMLDGLEDPHNLGAVLRSVDASGCDGVIIPKNRSVRLNETVAKVSTGSIEHVDVAMVTNLNQTITKLKELNYWVTGVELSGNINYTDASYDGKRVVVIGSEGKGISSLVLKNCDEVVKIPMFGKVNSLNASVSSALILYEVVRQRGINVRKENRNK